MPPPMSEKQVPLPGTDAPCQCLTMYGHTVVAIANGKIHCFDCLEEKKVVSIALPEKVKGGSEVYKVIAYKTDLSSQELRVVLIEN